MNAARTMDWNLYTEPAVLDRERHMLRSGWQLAGHEKQIAETGAYQTVTITERDFFLLRGEDGTIRCFANVCPHRGHQLVSGSGRKKRIACPYHGWTFAGDGTLLGLQKLPGSRVPDRADVCLRQIPCSSLAGFVFVNPDADAPSLAEYAAGLEAQIHAAVPDIGTYVLEGGQALGHTYECRANWKVLIDNYLECHHCGTAHASFNDLMDIANSRFTLHGNFVHQVAPTAGRRNSMAFPLDPDHDVTTGNFWFLFPNTMLGQFPGVPGFYASRLDPVSPDLTRRQTLSLTLAEPTDPDMDRRHRLRSEWSANIVSQEDRALCESVQRGMAQGAFTRGWYVLDEDAHGISEHAMQHFHATYLSAMERNAEALQ